MISRDYTLGIDIGSTTVKIAVLDASCKIMFADYRRHHADIQGTLRALVQDALGRLGDVTVHPVITGSGGLTLATHLQVPFVQEVVSVSTALERIAPKTDVAIELGGEDAKIIYFENGSIEQRMNGICAGGTGSFIDQMASLLQTDAAGLNSYARGYRSLYTIAARCGVFAKSDIQPLINEGATKEDLAASIFQAVVNQTISGLACGKPIRGHVAFLGGPLHFLPELKKAFIRTLKLDDEHTIDVEYSHLFAAMGSAMNAQEDVFVPLSGMAERLSGKLHMEFEIGRMDPLFSSQEEYDEFCRRHEKARVQRADLSGYHGKCFLGIDAGSTTTKLALVGEDGSLLYSFYSNNNGSPVRTAIASMTELHRLLPADAKIVRSCSTGYGEALLKAAFMLDEGEVETIAHYYAAAFFDPEVDCILDIGGQDMKCIRIKNHAVDNVLLNEACSSGCGSFIETFANSLAFSVQDFAKAALFARHPIDLGTRCTVFMNSRVKQAQKEGADVSDISAGLAYSVIKNALFKVIKVSDASQLGKNIVVQGGTFYNDAVLRSVETISGGHVTRPDIAGIMGAFGAALIARERYNGREETTMLSFDEIENLQFETTLTTCGRCTNNCRLTINHFLRSDSEESAFEDNVPVSGEGSGSFGASRSSKSSRSSKPQKKESGKLSVRAARAIEGTIVGEAAGRAKEAAGHAKETALETAGRARESALETAERARSSALETAERAKSSALETAERARSSALETAERAAKAIEESTIGGAAGRAAKTIEESPIGEAAGHARDSAFERAGHARDTALETAGRAKDSAFETAGRARDTALETAERARNTALETAGRAAKALGVESPAANKSSSRPDKSRRHHEPARERLFISGNRCERGLGKEAAQNNMPNLYKYKLGRIFGYRPLPKDQAPRGTVGIPRVLNMYEDYPFWATFFTKLGYRVVLSPLSTHRIYEMGIESIPSESACYPAKIAHGHVMWLIEKGVDFIFYPSLFYERSEFASSDNHYNCPIVTSYPENIRNNVEEITDGKVIFRNPFMAFTSVRTITEAMEREFGEEIPADEIRAACAAGWEELEQSRVDIRKKGEEVLKFMEDNHVKGIVLAGRPYHIDPEINHGIPEMITSYGIAVLSEDSISHLSTPDRPITVLDQWMYHSRLYAAANYVRLRDDLEMIQLNSFGCGIDAVTTDQVNDILAGSDKIYTCLKIDEVNNLGSARIRVRSLIAAIRIRDEKNTKRNIRSTAIKKVPFTVEMRKNYTILCPQMSPIHFDLLEPAIRACGYNLVVLPNDNRRAVDFGLKYVNNDACYPSLFVVGQIMEALDSGKYDLDRTAVLMTQTGGGCRASNYVGFIRRALSKAGMGQIPVVSVNMSGLEENPGFKLNLKIITRAAYAIVLGDVMMRCVYRMRPYELKKGMVEAKHQKWLLICTDFLTKTSGLNLPKVQRLAIQMIRDFDAIPIREERRPRVGIVGEILVKYAPAANNYLVDLLEQEGAEATVPDLMGFMLYCFYNQIYKAEHLGTSKKTARKSTLGIRAIEAALQPIYRAYEKSVHFDAPASIYKLVEYAEPIVSIGNETGEGWFLTGEMIELIKDGVENIVCIQPFGCLPNHVVGKGVIKAIRREYPLANIAAIDYDPGASEVNQLNRIKLMLATAQKNMLKKQAGEIPGAADDTSVSESDRISAERTAMELAPEIESDNASIGCVPDTEAGGSALPGKEDPAHRRTGKDRGLFRRLFRRR